MVERPTCARQEARHGRALHVDVVELCRILGHVVIRGRRPGGVQPRRLQRIRAIVEDEHVAVVRQSILLACLRVWIPAVKTKRLEDVVLGPLVFAIEITQIQQKLRKRAGLVWDKRGHGHAGGAGRVSG
jgi:hypothetical protein